MTNKIQKFLKKIHNRVFLGGFLAVSGIDSDWFKKVGEKFGGEANSPVKAQNLGELIAIIVQILLIVAGSIAVIFLIVGGYRYVTAHGNEEQMEAAKKTMTGAIIGLVIITVAFAIVSIIIRVLLEGVGGTGF